MLPQPLRGASVALLILTLSACGSTGSTPTPTPTDPARNVSDTLSPQGVASPVTLTLGQPQQLTVTVGGRAPAPGQLVWTTSNAAVASVTQAGLVTPVSGGNATVRAALSRNAAAFIDFPLTVSGAAPTPTPAPAPAPATDFAQQILDLVNAARAQGRTCGATAYAAAPALTLNAQLGQAAQGHAADMAAQNYFSHDSKDGRTAGQRIAAAGYAYRTWGENIAAGQATAAQVMDGWLKSEGHCKNIMNPAFRELGVGYATSTSGPYWVQDFGAR
ncbi:CAP domain-containing protein [Deinococcus depolymerans]|uniref:BIG2 domain-containing protein n=1 Tax=Deinococcus depolymerans TaxID=392408 RepID=A0ABP3LPE0_9DEIO